jgi:hypothetical protein
VRVSPKSTREKLRQTSIRIGDEKPRVLLDVRN